MKIAINKIRMDGGTQPRAEMNKGVIADYAEAMRDGAVFPPVTVFYDGTDYWLADGFHRVNAEEVIGYKETDADIRQGDRRDAVLFSVGANQLHGLRRTNKDKERAVETVLLNPLVSISPKTGKPWTDNEIARLCGVACSFVGRQRASLFPEKSENRTYRTKHRTIATMNVANIGRGRTKTETDFLKPEPDSVIESLRAEQQERENIAAIERTKEIRRERCEENEIQRQQTAAIQVEIPQGKYQCIVIDPPWPMVKIERDERPNQIGFEYPTMDEQELSDFPVSDMAADDCHLYLWTTHKFIPMALRLADAWGFKYQCMMTWVKNVGFTPFSWMYSTEHVLFCRKGNLTLQKLGMRLDFNAKVREHSRKPDVFYDLVKSATPGPRINIFSREKRNGFDQYGNEAERFGL